MLPTLPLSDPDKPVIWRGPMLHGALQQLMRDVNWGALDYLVMEYLLGCSLADVLRQQEGLPLAWSVEVLEQAGSAVEEAHREDPHGIAADQAVEAAAPSREDLPQRKRPALSCWPR